MFDLKIELDKFRKTLTVDKIKSVYGMHIKLAIRFRDECEDEMLESENIENTVQKYINGETNRIHSSILIPVVDKLLNTFNKEELMSKILKSYNLTLEEFLMLALNPANISAKQDIMQGFIGVCERLIPNDFKLIQNQISNLISLYNLSQVNFKDAINHPLSINAVDSLKKGDLILFKEEYKGYSTFNSGMLGEVSNYLTPEGIEVKRGWIMANDLYDGMRGISIVLNPNAVYKLQPVDLLNDKYKGVYLKELENFKSKQEDSNDTNF